MSIRFHCTCGRDFKVPDSAAGKRAKCLQCGKVLTVPHPHPAPGGKPAASAKPKAAPPARRAAAPARPAAPGPAASEQRIPVARVIEEKDVPLAQLAQTAKKHHIHHAVTPHYGKPGPGSAKAALGIVTMVMLWMALEVIVPLASAVRQPGGVTGLGWLHALWLMSLVIGFFVAAAAAKGSRFSIGLMLGGAFRGVINGAVIVVFVTLGAKVWVDWPKYMLIYGWAAVALSAVYIVLLLFSGDMRRHLSGHGGTVAGAAVMGAMLGGVLVPTALPGPLFLLSREMTRPAEAMRMAKVLGAPELIDEKAKERVRQTMHHQMSVISRAVTGYLNKHDNQLPDDLGQVITKECPPSMFLAPGSAKPAPEADRKTGRFKGPIDIAYVMGGYHLFDLPDESDEPDVLRQLIVAYADPNCFFGGGTVVMRSPVAREFKSVEWLTKDLLAEEIEYTRKWMKRHPPRPPMKIERETPQRAGEDGNGNP